MQVHARPSWSAAKQNCTRKIMLLFFFFEHLSLSYVVALVQQLENDQLIDKWGPSGYMKIVLNVVELFL